MRALIVDFGGVLDDGPEVLAAVGRVRTAGFPVAPLSDAHAVPDGVAQLFDAVVLGPAAGVRKPDPEVFRRTAERLGDAVEDCVVDDLVADLRGAGAVVVQHRDPEVTVPELELLFDLV